MSSYISEAINELEFRKLQIENAISVLKEIEPSLEPSIKTAFINEQRQDKESETFKSAVDNRINEKSEESVIQKEDIIKCIFVEERDDGVDSDLIPVPGKEYRVIDILRKGKKKIGYEVLDDESDNKIRMFMFPHELELLRKRRKSPPRVMLPSILKKCACGEDVVLLLNNAGTDFECICESCGETFKEKNTKRKG